MGPPLRQPFDRVLQPPSSLPPGAQTGLTDKVDDALIRVVSPIRGPKRVSAIVRGRSAAVHETRSFRNTNCGLHSAPPFFFVLWHHDGIASMKEQRRPECVVE